MKDQRDAGNSQSDRTRFAKTEGGFGLRQQPGAPLVGGYGGLVGGGGGGFGAPGAPVASVGVPATASATPSAGAAAAVYSETIVLERRIFDLADAKADAAKPGATAPTKPATGLRGRTLADGSVAYRVEKGDTLSTIAQRAYGRSADWKRILEANATTLRGNEKALRLGAEIIVPGPVARVDEPASTAIAQTDLDRMARVLERRLLALALYERLPAGDRAVLPPLEAELSRLIVGDAVEVVVRADSAAVLDALSSTGLRVNRLEAPTVDAALALVTIPVARLQEVALTQGIRAIAPAGS